MGTDSQNQGQPNSLENLPAHPLPVKIKQVFLQGLGISDASFLKELRGLTSLQISNNQISDAGFLKELRGLTYLNIGNNQISDTGSLKELKGLTYLNIGNNQISDAGFLKELKGLTFLQISNNKISNAGSLKELKRLTFLNINNNKISDAGFLKELKGLTSLHISHNKISDAGSLKELKGLNSLNISNNKISDAGSLKELKGLTSLDISNNQISDAGFLKELKGLNSLNISNNKISDAGSLKELRGLNSLHISNNQISDAGFLKELRGLNSLHISNNKISDAGFLKELKGLTSLDIGNNKIDDLTPFINHIKSGVTIDWNIARKNGFVVKDNPFTIPPVEIVKRGNDSILNFFNQIEEQGGTAPLYEARLIMVGEPGAGKTSLTEKLIDEKHEVKPDDPKKQSTLGINIKENWQFVDSNRSDEEFTAHIWDFGGQEIQYMTHQFFLTPESLYVLVADDRKQHTLFPYWFEVIRLLANDEAHGHSPIIVVLNERNNKSITNFDVNEYRKRYPDTPIEVCEVDLCDTNLLRFRQLRERIQVALCNLSHVGKPLPKKWPVIREELLELKNKRNYISMNDFKGICAKHKITREADLALISLYLHRLGAILHFQKDRQLKDFIVISPPWALKAIYVILEDKAIEKANGYFTEESIDRYWKDLTEYERTNVLNLMKKESFEIIYPVKGGYIAPQLLPKVSPELYWENTYTLKCQFYYRFMPKGIVTRLIVRKHNHIKDQSLVWARGCVFHAFGCDILVIEKETERDGIIQIEVNGKGREGIRALDFVRNEIEEIHEKWFSDIAFEPKVPCNCEHCLGRSNPTYFELSKLTRRINQNRPTIECDKIRVKDVPVRGLLEGNYDEEAIKNFVKRQRYERDDISFTFKMDNPETMARLEDIEEKLDSNFEAQTRNHAEIMEYLPTILKYSKEHKEALDDMEGMIDALPAKVQMDLDRIDKILTDRLEELFDKLPTSNEIVKAWKAATDKDPLAVDTKWKLKLKIKFLFGELEREVALSEKPYREILNSTIKEARENLIDWWEGNKTLKQLFIK
ncbi:MAG: hypothetical protein GC192_01545 [Bacteroidetes bacterium]|nr:hypothetical protein [Bacteroidota bacterium]